MSQLFFWHWNCCTLLSTFVTDENFEKLCKKAFNLNSCVFLNSLPGFECQFFDTCELCGMKASLQHHGGVNLRIWDLCARSLVNITATIELELPNLSYPKLESKLVKLVNFDFEIFLKLFFLRFFNYVIAFWLWVFSAFSHSYFLFQALLIFHDYVMILHNLMLSYMNIFDHVWSYLMSILDKRSHFYL